MSEAQLNMNHSGAAPAVIVAGFGLPGRSVCEQLEHAHIPFRVIEANLDTVSRCQLGGTPIIQGDARRPELLIAAGIQQARWLVLTIPDDLVALDIIAQARKINPACQIIARCAYTSTGMEAIRRGARQVVVSEQVIANELARHVSELMVELPGSSKL